MATKFQHSFQCLHYGNLPECFSSSFCKVSEDIAEMISEHWSIVKFFHRIPHTTLTTISSFSYACFTLRISQRATKEAFLHYHFVQTRYKWSRQHRLLPRTFSYSCFVSFIIWIIFSIKHIPHWSPHFRTPLTTHVLSLVVHSIRYRCGYCRFEHLSLDKLRACGAAISLSSLQKRTL